jgi:hypothetical protein
MYCTICVFHEIHVLFHLDSKLHKARELQRHSGAGLHTTSRNWLRCSQVSSYDGCGTAGDARRSEIFFLLSHRTLGSSREFIPGPGSIRSVISVVLDEVGNFKSHTPHQESFSLCSWL